MSPKKKKKKEPEHFLKNKEIKERKLEGFFIWLIQIK